MILGEELHYLFEDNDDHSLETLSEQEKEECKVKEHISKVIVDRYHWESKPDDSYRIVVGPL